MLRVCICYISPVSSEQISETSKRRCQGYIYGIYAVLSLPAGQFGTKMMHFSLPPLPFRACEWNSVLLDITTTHITPHMLPFRFHPIILALSGLKVHSVSLCKPKQLAVLTMSEEFCTLGSRGYFNLHQYSNTVYCIIIPTSPQQASNIYWHVLCYIIS